MKKSWRVFKTDSTASEHDELSFRRAYEQYASNIYKVGLLYLKQPSAAEDVVQDVFLELWQKREKLLSLPQLENYLFIIARNNIFDRFRKEKYADLYLKEALALTDPMQEHSLLDSVQQKEYHDILQEAIADLPIERRKIYQCWADGLSYKKIAELQDISINTVKTQLRLAQQSIRTHMAQKILFIMMAIFFS